MIESIVLAYWLNAQNVQCTIGADPGPSAIVLESTGIASWGAECGPEPTTVDIAAYGASEEYRAARVADLAAVCANAARAELDAVVGAELSIVEQIATATNPVTPGYEQRRLWRDWLIGRRDIYVGTTLPAITDPAELTPCPDAGYLDFATWEAQQ